MGSLVRRPAPEWPALAEFICAWNRRDDGGVHCLHAASGPDVASHAAELAALAPDEAAFWTVAVDGRIVGVFGCEFDPALRRGWLRGPLAAAPEVLESMLASVEPTLAAALPEIVQYEAFPAADDAALNAWYDAARFTPLQVHTALRAATSDWPAPPPVVARASAADLPALLALHGELFPSPYLGEVAFRRALDAADCALFVARADGSAPAGYLYVSDHAAEREAYVDFVGVESAQRGRGLGEALLRAAARWGAEHSRQHLALTVREDRPGARRLYRRLGFVEVSTGRHWRKTASGAPA